MKRLGLYLLSIPLLLALTACVDTSRKAYTVSDAGTGSAAVCGDGRIMADERCDDGNAAGGDGCSATCQVESGYSCGGEPSSCAQGVGSCGDGKLAAGEGCDDGNTSAGDGCSASCAVEAGYSCDGIPSRCILSALCGNGAINASEVCDDGNGVSGDGCSGCGVDPGWGCRGEPSVCVESVCGNGNLEASETCDDGNTSAGDGCSPTCHLEAGGQVRAFPGAEGYGTETKGGRGGKVIKVTTLDWSGPGSFSEALMTVGPRIIVFDVSGVIEVGPDAGYDMNLEPKHSYVTVAGQTSPGGITFRGSTEAALAIRSYPDGPEGIINTAKYDDSVQFHDAVFQHLRFRGTQNNMDNVSLAAVYNIVFDHCDFSGSKDEVLDITYAHDVTVQWSTMANGGDKGPLIAYYPTNHITMHHNLSLNQDDRCGVHFHWEDVDNTVSGGAMIDLRNNVLHNCFMQPYRDDTNRADGRIAYVNLVGNTLTKGPNSTGEQDILLANWATRVFSEDNLGPTSTPGYVAFMNPSASLETEEKSMASVSTDPRADAVEKVLAQAGAWPRDQMNKRSVEQVRTKGGELHNTDSVLLTGGGQPAVDSDNDGMPDEWETAHGLNAELDDSAGDADGDGYTNIEEYLYERSQEIIGR